jgi:hypothetical protein
MSPAFIKGIANSLPAAALTHPLIFLGT